MTCTRTGCTQTDPHTHHAGLGALRQKNGSTVSAFEKELASYCGAKYAIAAANGTVTLQAALVALGVKPGDRVAVPPLTMSATTIAVLNVGAVPVFADVDPRTWIMQEGALADWWLPVALYGLWGPLAGPKIVEDAAQTLRKHDGAAFTSISFQASKILSLGEGGALLTDDEELAERARSYLSLGYRMAADQARIDNAALKSPTFDRHHSWPAINGRMNDVTAAKGLTHLNPPDTRWCGDVDNLLADRRQCATMYRDAIAGCDWLTPQHVPNGWTHDYWTYAVACDTPDRAQWLLDTMEPCGGEIPYPAWKLTYDEPAFRHLDPGHDSLRLDDRELPGGPHWRRNGGCPVAESLQPRLIQFQTNTLAAAQQNARALGRAIRLYRMTHGWCEPLTTTGIPCG